MKKKLILTFLFLSLSLQSITIFAQPQNTSIKTASELKRISESINLTINGILQGNYDPDKVLKDMEFQRIRLNSVVSEVDSAEKSSQDNLLLKREYAVLLYIVSAYKLGINGISLYMQDKNNIDFLSDAIVEVREGDRNLTELIKSLENIYNVKVR